MKYTLYGFQQSKLIENKLTNDDALILRLVKDMFSTAGMEFKDFDGTKYMWVNYTFFLNQIPIIGSKRNLMRRIEYFGKEFLLLRKLQNTKNGKKGSFSYIAPTKKLDELQDYDLVTNSHEGYDKMSQGVGQNVIEGVTKCHNKDTSIKDASIKDNKTYSKEFEEFYSLYPKPVNKDLTYRNYLKAVKKDSADIILQATNNYINEIDSKGTDKQYIFKSSNFVGEAMQYKNYIECEEIQVINPYKNLSS